jgi:hypothetical protein
VTINEATLQAGSAGGVRVARRHRTIAPSSRPGAGVGLRSSWCPKVNVHIHGVPTGATLKKIRPTTAPSSNTSKSSSLRSPAVRLAEARLGVRHCSQPARGSLAPKTHRAPQSIERASVHTARCLPCSDRKDSTPQLQQETAAQSRPTDKASTRGTHQGQRSCATAPTRPDMTASDQRSSRK